MTWSASFFEPCDLPNSDDALVLGAGTYTYDTDDGELTDPTGQSVEHDEFLATSASPDLRILVAGTLQVEAGGTLRVIGTLPFAIAAWQTVTIDGVIDVGARGPLGAAGSQTCAGITAGQTDTGGGGGGGAGGFGGAGATGGMGDLNGPGASSGGSGGPALALPTSLVGGCAGAKGGDGDDPGGAAGAGGGAVAIAAAGSIAISGTVRAGRDQHRHHQSDEHECGDQHRRERLRRHFGHDGSAEHDRRTDRERELDDHVRADHAGLAARKLVANDR